MNSNESGGVVGTDVMRTDGLSKTTGRAKYVDDLVFPGMLHGRTVRSTIARGRVRSVRLDFDAAQFTVVDHHDIPGPNVITLIEDDQPCLVVSDVRHVAEPILLLAHEDRDALLSARVDIDYELLPPLFDPQLSDVVFRNVVIERGDVERGLLEADVIVEGEYVTGHQEQLYIETNGVIAVPSDDGGVTIYGSLQCPYYVQRALKVMLDMPGSKVRVVQTETGGGFGGKEEYPSMLSAHAALLALKSRRPVKMIYDRTEDMLATTKRHPFVVRHRTGLALDGTLVAMDIQILVDGGAYTTLSPVVLSRGALHAAGPYRCDNVRIDGRCVMTNTPPNGAFRGFGAPQTLFAAEVHMERIAEQLGVDSLELRRHNALRPGDATATGQILAADCSAVEVLEEAVRRSNYVEKRRTYEGTNRGIGLALFFHGSGFTGIGEVHLASKASLALTETGVVVLAATVDMGQGTRTVHAQIVADTLGIPVSQVEVADPDTMFVPDSGPTVASRTTMVVGGILRSAALELKEKLGGMPPGEYFLQHGPLVVTREYERPPGMVWDEHTYKGDAYATFAWACDVAEVEVDPDTYEVKPLLLTAVQDIGKAINPVLAAGQIEGGSGQGVGFALIENVVMRDGAMANPTLTNYTIPTTLDTPPMDVVIFENPYVYGPFGAKGVGELPIDGPAPALVNALRQVGYDVRSLPVLPEHLMTAPLLRESAGAA
jgi:CO/xanthine dehydrogenase Mo-binding subunit